MPDCMHRADAGDALIIRMIAFIGFVRESFQVQDRTASCILAAPEQRSLRIRIIVELHVCLIPIEQINYPEEQMIVSQVIETVAVGFVVKEDIQNEGNLFGRIVQIVSRANISGGKQLSVGSSLSCIRLVSGDGRSSPVSPINLAPSFLLKSSSSSNRVHSCPSTEFVVIGFSLALLQAQV